MTWKEKYGWQDLELDDIKPGMEAMLIIEEPWGIDSWVIGQKGRIFTIIDRRNDVNKKSITVDHKGGCSDSYKHFKYRCKQ